MLNSHLSAVFSSSHVTYSHTLLKEDCHESTCFINLISPTKISCYRHWRACRG
ncbi:hypothetical protein C5K19_20350, partial [Shigella flexneri]